MFQEDFRLIANLKENIFISYHNNFIKDDDHTLFDFFEKNIIYNTDEESKIKICGKEILIPRKQVAYGEKGLSYTFSGATVFAKDWNNSENNSKLCEVIMFLKNKVAKRFNFNPNFVLINRYENGDQYIGFHSDDEKDLNLYAPIVGISFGTDREIVFMNNNENSDKKKLLLRNGSAFCMHYPTNINYKHSIPKNKNIKNPRISFAFREMHL